MMRPLQDLSNEINETLGQTYGVPDEIDEEELMGELDLLEVTPRVFSWLVYLSSCDQTHAPHWFCRPSLPTRWNRLARESCPRISRSRSCLMHHR